MKRFLILVLPLVAGLMVTGCVNRVPAYTSEGYLIEVGVNREFDVVVEIEIDGEYFWEQDFDESKLELVESVCVICSPDIQSYVGLIGPYNRFRYRALAPGDTEIAMTNRRPLEAEAIDRRVFQVRIK